MNSRIKIIAIGGSWGGLQASLEILKDLPPDFSVPIILILHRMKNYDSELDSIFNKKVRLKVKEVEDKEPIKTGYVYLAPADYHVLIENDHTFSLDISELENYSRPSIDVTFTSIADVYGSESMGILLTGANKDGSKGLMSIGKKGGTVIVQDPQEAEIGTMPQSAIDLVENCKILRLNQINFLLSKINGC